MKVLLLLDVELVLDGVDVVVVKVVFVGLGLVVVLILFKDVVVDNVDVLLLIVLFIEIVGSFVNVEGCL